MTPTMTQNAALISSPTCTNQAQTHALRQRLAAARAANCHPLPVISITPFSMLHSQLLVQHLCTMHATPQHNNKPYTQHDSITLVVHRLENLHLYTGSHAVAGTALHSPGSHAAAGRSCTPEAMSHGPILVHHTSLQSHTYVCWSAAAAAAPADPTL